jgi:phosphoacetylglucosamine mutase
MTQVAPLISDIIQTTALNADTTTVGVLNHHCGADYVKTKQALPPSIASSGILKTGVRCCSFDGDADRLIYYYLRDGKEFRLLDGDKIAVMVALYLKELVGKAKLAGEAIEVGMVQTAYANGSSTKYLSNVSGYHLEGMSIADVPAANTC